MSNPAEATPAATPEDRQEHLSAMFVNAVIQQTNLATIFLGLAPNPQTGETAVDLAHAQYFIDQLEMLQVKTKGNLSKPEEGLLRQSLTSLRMAFVEAVSKPVPPAAVEEQPAAAAPAPEASPAAPDAETPASDDSKKKFTKKY